MGQKISLGDAPFETIELIDSVLVYSSNSAIPYSSYQQVLEEGVIPKSGFLGGSKFNYSFLEIENQSSEFISIFLNIGIIDSANVIILDDAYEILKNKISGTHVQYAEKDVIANGWTENFINFQIEANSTQYIFIELVSLSGQRETYLPKISHEDYYFETRETEHFVQGVFQGVMLIICTLSLIIYVARKRLEHMYYALFVFFLYLMFLPIYGYTKSLTSSYAQDVYIWTFSGQFAAAFCIQFFRYSLKTPSFQPKLDKLLVYMLYSRGFTISLAFISAVFGIAAHLVRYIILGVDIMTIFAAIYAIVVLLKRNDFFAQYILASTIALVAGLSLTVVGSIAGWDLNPHYFLQAGVIIQNLILSLGLGFLIKSKFEEEIAKRQEDIVQQMEINFQLEQQVNLRTRALENQKDFIQKIIDEMPNHVFVRNSQGNYKIVNRAFAEYYGKKKEDFIGKSILETHSNMARAQKYLQEDKMVLSQDMKVSDEYLLDPKSGKWVYFYKVPFKLGRKSYVLCMEIDITDIKRASNQLKQTNKELNKAIDHLHQAQSEIIQKEKMAVLGRLSAGIAHEINTPLGVIKGSVDYLIESFGDIGDIIQTINEKVPSDLRPNILEIVKKAAETYRFLTSSEERTMVAVLAARLEKEGVENAHHLSELSLHLDVDGDFDKLLPIWKLPQSQDIFEAIQLLFFRFNSVYNIKNAMEKANKILFAIKSYTHFKNEGLFKTVDLRLNIENVLIMFENILKGGIEVEFDVPEGTVIYGLPDELGQVWTNLISNAVHAMDKKGVLSISCEETDEHYIVSVQDNGTGIPIDMQDKIFEPFFTTKSAGHGSGLGLDIIKRIVEKHNGLITFKSEPGRTIFFVQLNKELNPVTIETETESIKD